LNVETQAFFVVKRLSHYSLNFFGYLHNFKNYFIWIYAFLHCWF